MEDNLYMWKLFGIFLLLLVSPLTSFADTILSAPIPAALNKDNPGQYDHLISPSLDKGVLLVAGKNLYDPNFEKTIVLVTEYTEDGTVGLVINRPTKVTVAEALPKLSDYMPYLDFLYFGGPVATTGVSLLLKSETRIPGTNQVISNIYHINTMDLFNVLLVNKIDKRYIRIYAGFAGWAPGQLESELIRGDWYIWHADINLVFNSEPEILWDELIRMVTAKWVSR